jgi:hypothetical protein
MLLAACSAPTTSQSEASVCQARSEFQDALAAFRDLDPQTASIDEYRAAWVLVRDTFLELRFYRTQLGEENFDAAQAAVDDMATAVDDLPSDATASDAVEAVQSQRAELDAAVDGLGQDVDCG